MERKIRWQISKKEHSCDLCGKKIRKGEKHKSWWNKPDAEWDYLFPVNLLAFFLEEKMHTGVFENYRMHQNCWKFEQYYLEWNDWEGWSDDDISEHIQDLAEDFPKKKWKGERIDGYLQYCQEDNKLAHKLVRETDWEVYKSGDS